jgi:folate-binding protein YgfZ
MNAPDESRANVSWRESYDAFIDGEGVLPLPYWSAVEVRGADARTLIQNLCTNDLRKVEPGQGCEAFFPDVKGKLVAHAIVLVRDGQVLLVMPPGLGDKVATHLDRYVIREDAQVGDRTDQLQWLLVPQSAMGQLEQRTSVSLSSQLNATWAHRPLPASWCAEGSTSEQTSDSTWCVRSGLTTPPALLIGIETAEAGQFLGRLGPRGALPAACEAWEAIRLEGGWPLYGVDFDGSHLPQEVGRDREAISFTKGCYLGQETVARIDALGHVNRRLVRIGFAGDAPVPVKGASLTAAGQAVGQVTSASWSPQRAAPLAMAMVRRGHESIGARVTCGGHEGTVVGEERA